jgi:hypothetical protein
VLRLPGLERNFAAVRIKAKSAASDEKYLYIALQYKYFEGEGVLATATSHCYNNPMQHQELWNELEQYELSRGHFSGRPLVVIPFENFKEYASEFKLSYNPLNKKINYRTHGAFTHIHAVQTGKYIEFHADYFNPSVSIILAIPHFFISVIPYFVSLWLQGKKPYVLDL